MICLMTQNLKVQCPCQDLKEKKLASKVFICVIYPGIQNYVSFSRKTITRNFLSKMACESTSSLIWNCPMELPLNLPQNALKYDTFTG